MQTQPRPGRTAPETRSDGNVLELEYRPPLAWAALTAFLTQRGARSVEQRDGAVYRRSVAHGPHEGWISVVPDDKAHILRVSAAPGLADALPWLRNGLRRLFDLDADPAAINAHLNRDIRLATRLQQTPGLRIPGTLDGFELALRAVLGQQVSVKAASTLFTRFADYFGAPIDTPFAGIDRIAPRAGTIADARLQQIIDRGLPARRAETVQLLAQNVVSGALRLNAAAPADATRAALQALPGIGPWTAQYISMRALADPDAFPDRDLGLMRALGMDKPGDVNAVAEHWRPWRAYGAMHLWHNHGSGG